MCLRTWWTRPEGGRSGEERTDKRENGRVWGTYFGIFSGARVFLCLESWACCLTWLETAIYLV